MERYIKVYDDTLPAELCDRAIAQFREEQEQADNPSIVKRHTHDETDGYLMSFNEVNLATSPRWEWLNKELCSRMMACAGQYLKDCSPRPGAWPDKIGYEAFRLKHYKQNEGRFDEHVDVGDLASARRFLVFFWYLCDVEKGGETVFPDLDITVEARKGRLLVFPPMWTYPHIGRMPESGDKFIVGGYLHYV